MKQKAHTVDLRALVAWSLLKPMDMMFSKASSLGWKLASLDLGPDGKTNGSE